MNVGKDMIGDYINDIKLQAKDLIRYLGTHIIGDPVYHSYKLFL